MKQLELKGILNYDAQSGIFTWKISKGRVKTGDIAGVVHKKRGYVIIQIDGKKHQAHRLAWLYVYGEYPKQHTDHINHNRADNRIVNLREATNAENNKNISKPKSNTSGIVGVFWNKKQKRWNAQISIDGVRKFLGCFIDFSDAVNARKNAEVLYGYHENHGKGK